MTGDRTTDLKRSAVMSGTGIHRLIYRDICVAATAHNKDHICRSPRDAESPPTAHGDESPSHDGVSAGWRFDFNGSAYVRIKGRVPTWNLGRYALYVMSRP